MLSADVRTSNRPPSVRRPCILLLLWIIFLSGNELDKNMKILHFIKEYLFILICLQKIVLNGDDL